jgi:hypothetical protein
MANLKHLVPTLLTDIVAPVGAYYALHAAGANDWVALLGGTVVSGALLVGAAVRTRRVDVFSGFMLGMFGVGLVTSFLTGNVMFMVLKASLVSGLIGVAFLVSALVGRPLTYLAMRRAAGDAAALDAKYAAIPRFRQALQTISVVWGIGLVAEAVVRGVLAYQLPVSAMVGLSTVLTVGTTGVLLLVSILVAKRARRSAPVV